MSTVVDERVVEMRFDNRNFENNVNTSLSTLDKLKNALNFKGANKGLETLDRSAKKLSFNPLEKSVEAVYAKFSALDVMAMTTLNRITNSAITTGKNLVNAFTIDPVKTGMQEYETQINAVQTILANTKSKGSTIKDVNAALDELNKYADMTIYNFTEMTRNIGTFTAAGVGLKESTQAIKGIANLAAVSGSSSQQASTAMYQLSQALAAGKVNLQDWNSVVNAGMGGEVFQEALKRTARVMGTGVDEAIKKYGTFRESLTKGAWLTTDVLTETLAQLSGAYTEAELIGQGYTKQQAKDIADMAQTATDAATKVKTFTQLMDTLKEAAQSGWTKTWQLIIGDFEEAKEVYTEASNFFGGIIDKASDSRNKLLQGALQNSVNLSDWNFLKINGSVSKDYEKLLIDIAKTHGININEMIKENGSFVESLKEGWLTADILSESMKIVDEQVKSLGESAGYSNPEIEELINRLNTKPSGRDLLIDTLRNSIQAIIKPIAVLKESWREVFPPMTSSQLYDLIEKVNEFSKKLILTDKGSEALRSTLTGLFKVLKSVTTVVGDGLKTAFNEVSSLLKTINFDINGTAKSFGETLSMISDWIVKNVSLSNGIKIVSSTLQNGISIIKKWCENVKTVIKNTDILQFTFNSIGSIVRFVFSGIRQLGNYLSGKLAPILSTIGAGFANLFQEDVMTNGLNLLNSGVFSVGILSMKNAFDTISDTLESFDGGMFASIKNILDGVRGSLEKWQKNLEAKRLLTIASAIGILALALISISGIDGTSLTKSLTGIGILFAEMCGALIVLNKNLDDYKMISKASTAMIAMSVAILLLSTSVKKLASLSDSDLTKGLIGIGVLSAMMTTVSIILSKNATRMTKGMSGMILFAAGIKLLVSAVEDMGQLSLEEMIKGLVGVGALLGEILAFSKLNTNTKGILKTSIAMTALGASMKILASSLKDFSSMSWTEIGRGLTAMAGSLLELVIAIRLIPDGIFSKALGLTIIASSFVILSKALSSFGSMSWEEIGRGLTAMAGSLLTLAIALEAMNGTLAGSAALLVAAGAIAILTPSLLLLGNMSWESIGKGLLTLAGTFTVLGLAGLLLGPIAPILLALSAAVSVLGVGIFGLGAGVALLATGFTMLAAGGVAMTTSVMSSLSIIIAGLIGFIPLVAKQIANAIITFAKIIGDGASDIAKVVVQIVNAILDVLDGCVPRIIDVGLKIITSFLQSIRNYLPEIISTAIEIVVSFIDTVASKLPDIIESGINLIVSFLNGIGDGLSNHSAELGEAVRKVIFGIVDVVLEVLTGAISGILDIGKKWIVDGLIPGLLSFAGKAKDSFVGLVSTIKKAVSDKSIEFFSVGKNFVEGFINGIKSKFTSVVNAAKEMGTSALNAIKTALDIHSPSKKMITVGKFAVEGFTIALENGKNKVSKVTDALFKSFVSQAVKATNVKDVAKGAINQFAKNFVTSTKNSAKQVKIATKSIQAYMTEVYKSSSYYKEDKNQLASDIKNLKSYYKQKADLKKKLDKKGADTKDIKKQIKDVEKQIKTSKKQILKDQDQMVKNAKKAVKEVKKEIKNQVAEYIDIFNAAGKQIDLFGSVEESLVSSKNSIKSSLLDLTSVMDISLGTGTNFLEKFSSSLDDATKSIEDAKKSLTDSDDAVAKAQEKLAKAQAKSDSVNGRSQKYLDEITAAREELTKALEQQSEAQENLNKAEKENSPAQLLENMKSNVEGVKNWKQNLKTLEASGIDSSLFDYLKGLGVSGADQVEKFVKMTSDELKQANQYWIEYTQLSNNSLIDGLKEKSKSMVAWGESVKKFMALDLSESVKAALMAEFETNGINSAEYINQILAMNADELKDFEQSYVDMMKVPEQVADEVAKSIDNVNASIESSKIAIDSYLDTMKANIEAEKKYQENLKALKKRGISNDFYNYLLDNGDAQMIAHFANNATEEQLKEANELFAESARVSADSYLENYKKNITDEKKWADNMTALAKLNIPKKMKEALYSEFKEKGMDGNEELEMILGFTEKQLKSFVSNWKKGEKAKTSIADLIFAGSASVSKETEKNLKKTVESTAKTAIKALSLELKKQETTVKKAASNTGKAGTNALKKELSQDKTRQIGKDAGKGVEKGLNDSASSISKAAKKLAEDYIKKPIKKALDINSPSKVLALFGKYCDEGLAIGITNNANLVGNASESVADLTVDRMSATISAISEMANMEIDSSPVITPILNMDELMEQASMISGLFGTESIGVNARYASQISNDMNTARAIQNSSTTNNTYDQSTSTINNTFNITGDNPKEIANEVSRILQKQVNRRNAAWA